MINRLIASFQLFLLIIIMKLSERRAQNVYNMLTKEYGIPADRLTIKAEGSDSQVYDVNNWNRIVIFSQN